MQSCPTQAVFPLVELAAEKVIRDRYNRVSTRRSRMSLTRRRFIARTAATALFGAPAIVRSRGALAAGPGSAKGPVPKVHVGDSRAFAKVRDVFAADYPGMKMSSVDVDGQSVLRAERGGMRVFWIYQGSGEMFLPNGYRTQEGGQDPLPDSYEPDRIDPAFAETLGVLKEGLASLSEEASVHVEAILERWDGEVFVGDFPVELWNLEHLPRPWAEDERVEAALVSLFDFYRDVGYATKQAGSYEPIMAGDQVIARGEEEVSVRGRFRCLTLEKTDRTESHISTARRLRYLVDTAGGCSFDFDPFRRLPLTWYLDHPGQRGDGVNFVNSHVVNIPRELSSTHFHPAQPKIGGLPQTEMYLVLDGKTQQLEAHGRKPSILVFPDLTDLTQYQQHPLEPGDLVYIPPGVGHRGLDVFVNVLTVPGFKPHNEFYIDQDIRDRAGGKAPYNENGLDRRNYDRLENLL
ncbi:MAG: hypothetical protein ACQESR_02840 [Planctomycetota bacterium]